MSASAKADSFFVYIVRCADDSLYVGHTSDVNERVKVHNEGRGALWTACRRLVVLVYHEPQASAENAVARERQLKLHSTRSSTASLIAGRHICRGALLS